MLPWPNSIWLTHSINKYLFGEAEDLTFTDDTFYEESTQPAPDQPLNQEYLEL